MSTTTETFTSTTPSTDGRITAARVAIATGVALVLNLVVLWIGSASGATLEVEAPEPINALTVAISTVLPMALGAYVVARITRRRPGFQRFAAWAGAVAALLTAAMPFVASSDVKTATTLACMHVVVGLAWFAAARPTTAR
ncbi:MAG: hypothetical protein HGA44_07990 [Cellulomonadaceae bacterium]|nr:hypothetical protein [Cellulomonadaceae bacterium]